jgi:hypothetical protein
VTSADRFAGTLYASKAHATEAGVWTLVVTARPRLHGAVGGPCAIPPPTLGAARRGPINRRTTSWQLSRIDCSTRMD